MIYSLHGFTETSSGLTFLSVYIGFLIGVACYPLQRWYEAKARKAHKPEPFPEASLIWGFFAAFILPISLSVSTLPRIVSLTWEEQVVDGMDDPAVDTLDRVAPRRRRSRHLRVRLRQP